jgi:fatty acid desaturase
MNPDSPDYPIPRRLNVALAFLAAGAALALLRLASRASNAGTLLACAVGFSLVNNTLFSLLHEATHGIFHPSSAVNAAFGRWLAAFFPTSFTLQRFFHLGHHRRNRSPAERFDYLSPGENRWIKYIQWYGLLTGLYWLMPPLSGVIYFFAPAAFSSRVFQGEGAQWSRQSGTDAMVADVDRLPRGTVRGEIAFVVLWQAGMFWALGLTPTGWLACYGAFALAWSALQYADHAWSPLDPLRGAWNLRVNPVTKAFFLNYHDHLAHHEDPKIPWIHLPRRVDPRLPRPSFLSIYLRMWKGPRPLPADAQ